MQSQIGASASDLAVRAAENLSFDRMEGTERRKQSLYVDEVMLDEMRLEASRLNRSLSWVVSKAWKIARRELAAAPSANDAPDSGASDERAKPTARSAAEPTRGS